jgi:hypothetical protein
MPVLHMQPGRLRVGATFSESSVIHEGRVCTVTMQWLEGPAVCYVLLGHSWGIIEGAAVSASGQCSPQAGYHLPKAVCTVLFQVFRFW